MKKDDDLIQEILEFWFSEEVRARWFNSTPEFDDQLRDQYESIWQLARCGTYDFWAQEANSALALVIVLDQFPLNMFRQDARQYSTESHARRIASEAIDLGLDMKLQPVQQAFLYLPFMHSESLLDQMRSLQLYEDAGLEDNLRFARHHHDVVKRFGRFPHRNAALGRESTNEEIEYLKTAKW